MKASAAMQIVLRFRVRRAIARQPVKRTKSTVSEVKTKQKAVGSWGYSRTGIRHPVSRQTTTTVFTASTATAMAFETILKRLTCERMRWALINGTASSLTGNAERAIRRTLIFWLLTGFFVLLD